VEALGEEERERRLVELSQDLPQRAAERMMRMMRAMGPLREAAERLGKMTPS